MNDKVVHKLVHDVSNQINTAALNVCLLRQLHSDALDEQTMHRLDRALAEAGRILKEFQASNQLGAPLPIAAPHTPRPPGSTTRHRMS